MTDTPPGTPLPTVNVGASIADKTVENLIQATEKPVEAAIIAAQPFMATPVLKQLWEAALEWVFGIMGGLLGRATGYAFVQIEEYMALQKAAAALVALKAAQVSGDSNALSKANDDVDAAVTPVLHYVGSVEHN